MNDRRRDGAVLMLNLLFSRSPAKSLHQVTTRASAFQIAITYALVSGAWIAGSGWLLHALVEDPKIEALGEILKGFGFVAVTAGFLWVGLNYHFRQIRHFARQLEESETKWRSYMDGAPVGVLVADRHGRHIEANRTAEQMLGYGPGELLQTTIRDLPAPEAIESAAAHFASASRDGSASGQIPLRRKDGGRLWASVHATQLSEDRILAALLDITAQKQAQLALEEREQQLRLFVEHSPAAVAMLDLEMRYLIVSRRWYESYRLPETSVIGRSHYEVFPEIPERWREIHRRCLQGAIERCDADEFPRADGTVDWVRWQIHPWYDEGKVGGLIIFSEVITEQKKAERALAEEAIRRRILFEQSADGIVVVDQTGKVVEANRAYADLLGYTPDEVRELHLWDWDVQWSREQLIEMARRVDASGEHFETLHRRKDGSVIDVEISTNGAVLGGRKLVFCVCRNISGRKHAEEALRASEQRFRETLDNLMEGCLIIGFDWRYVYVNTAAAVQGHSTREALTGGKVMEVYPGIEKLPMFAALELCMNLRVPQETESEFVYPDGSRGWFQLLAQPVREGIFVLSLDITERRSSEARLRQLSRAVEQSPASIVITDTSGAIEYVNPRFTLTTGYTSEEVIGKNPRVLKSGLMSRDAYKGLWATILSGREWRGEFHNRRKDGEVFWEQASISPITDCDGKATHFVAVKEDITERKRVDEALRKSEERFRTLVEHAPMGIFVQAGGRFAYLNQGACEMFGCREPETLLGQPVLDRFLGEAREKVQERIRMLNEDRSPVPLAHESCLRIDGTRFEAEFSGVPIEWDGQLGALVFFYDVTSRILLEAQLRQAQKIEGIGQLAGGVAHDFNNILAVIMMHLGLLEMNPSLDPETRTAVKDLDAATRRAASLTRQLLMFSRRSVLSVQRLDLNDIVTNLTKMLGRLIGENVALRFDAFAGLPPVEADAGMMDQVLMNLVVNARDAMTSGGRITISTDAVEFSAEQASPGQERRPGLFVCLQVADTGVGMDRDTLKHIFEPFFTTKEAGRGTGLGLATVHGIVAQHKGWIEVESELGYGSVFRVYFPAVNQENARQNTQHEFAPIHRGRETILLVEDDAKVRLMIGQSLRILGYRVHEASNGREAVNLWQSHSSQIDLLLTDMVMPEGMTGLELAETLQVLKPGLKIIISSGYSSEIVQAGVPTRQGVAYLPKPYEIDTLARFVRECLDRKLEAS